jgi:hypothetical protein
MITQLLPCPYCQGSTEELEVRRGLSCELDEMWPYVARKSNPRWLCAIDHYTGKVLAYSAL